MKDKIKNLIEGFEGDSVNRTFVLYPNVLERYLKFYEEHRAYRRRDILSKALTEFLDEGVKLSV